MPETEIQRAKTAPAVQGGAQAQPEAQAPAQTPARPGAMSLGDYRARLRRPAYAYLERFAGPIVAALESGAATGTEHARLMARLAALFAVSHSADGFGETDAKRASNAYHAELGERAIGELEQIATAPGERTPGERWDAMTTLARKLEHDHHDLLEDDVALTVDLGTRDAAERAGGVEGRLRIAPNYLELLLALALMAAEQQLLPQVAARAPRGRTALDRRGRAGGGANVAGVTDAANRDFAGAARAALGANVQIDAVQVADGAAHRLTAGGLVFTVRLMVCPLGDHVVRPMINPSKTDVIQVSDRAAPSDVGRAMAHALGEIAAFRRAFAGNALPPVNDGLRAGAPGPAPEQPLAFSAHDQGAIAQLGQMLPRMTVQSGPEQSRLRRDVLLLIDALGLRGGGAATARREAVEARLRERGVAKLFFLRVMAQDEARLSGGLQRSLFEARLEEATEQRVEQREQIRHEPLHQPALQGGRRTAAEAQRLARLARGRRTAKSLVTVAKYRRAELEARPDYHRVRDPQIGGGAALASVRPGQLLIDDRGRWQQDAGDQLAQTAAQLRWVRDAGIGDPFEFVDRPEDRVPLAAVHYWLDTIAMQADVIDGTAAMDVDPQSRLLIRVTPAAGGAPISLEVSGQPVVATGFPREQLPVGRTNVLQVIQQLIAGLTNQANAGIPGFLARLQALDQRDDRALADVLQGVQPATTDAINLLPAPVPAALAGLRGAATATGAWLTERVRSRTRVLTGDEANSAAALNPDAAQHWVIAGPGGTGISAAEIILARSAVARVTMVGGNPTAGLLDNDQFRQVWRVHGPAGTNRFQVLTGQEIGSIATPDAGQHYTAGAAARGNQRLELPPPDVNAMAVVADQRWLVAARADLLPAVQRILGVAGTKVVIYGAVLPPDLHDAAVFRDLVERFGPAGQLRLQVLTGAYAANAQAAGPQPADGFQLTGPVQGDGYIAALGRTNQLSPVLNQLIRAARMRGPNHVRGELIYDADQQYIGYRIIIVAPDNSEKRIDVTGAASRFPPEDVFTEVERNQVTVAIRRQDAPSESGNFDGGFVASARQSARYGHHHRAEVEAAQVRDYRLTGNAGPLALRADQRAQWPAQVAEFLARELRVDRARLRVVALGGGATGDPLFKVSVGEAELGVFKVFADQAQAQNELDQLNFLAGLHLQRSQAVEGVVGTQPVPIDAQQGRRGILMRTAPGRSVDQMVTSLPARGAAPRTIAVSQIVESSRLVARALAEIHRMTNTGSRMLGQDEKTGAHSDARYILNKITADPNERAAAVRHALGDATNAVVARLQLRIDEMGAANVPACAYHGDANAGNFVIDGGTVRVIDVGNMRWSHAGADGNKSGANDVAKYLGSLETLHPQDANRLQADELQRIAEAFFAAYLAEFNQGGRNLSQADMTAAIVVFKVEQLIAAFHGHTLDNAAFRARMTGVLGL